MTHLMYRRRMTTVGEHKKESDEGSVMDVAQGERVEKELDAMIQRRARKGDVDPDEREELWKASVRAYTARRREAEKA
jgi:chorismate mutase